MQVSSVKEYFDTLPTRFVATAAGVTLNSVLLRY